MLLHEKVDFAYIVGRFLPPLGMVAFGLKRGLNTYCRLSPRVSTLASTKLGKHFQSRTAAVLLCIERLFHQECWGQKMLPKYSYVFTFKNLKLSAVGKGQQSTALAALATLLLTNFVVVLCHDGKRFAHNQVNMGMGNNNNNSSTYLTLLRRASQAQQVEYRTQTSYPTQRD